MDFELTEEQKMVQAMARDFADQEIKPKAPELDQTERHPAEIVQKMAELSLLGIAIPDTYGGGGADIVSYVVAMEEISRGCASVGVIMSVNNSLVCDPINTFGTEEQKKKYLTPLASGKKLGCFGLTEPEAGSDAAGPEDDGRAPGGRVGDQRQEELHHQRQRGRLLRAHGHDRQEQGIQRDQLLHRGLQDARLFRGGGGEEAGDQGLGNRGADHGGLPHSQGEPPGPGGAGLLRGHEHPGRRPDRDRLPGPGDRPGGPGGGGRVLQDAGAVRRSPSPSSRPSSG